MDKLIPRQPIVKFIPLVAYILNNVTSFIKERPGRTGCPGNLCPDTVDSTGGVGHGLKAMGLPFADISSISRGCTEETILN